MSKRKRELEPSNLSTVSNDDAATKVTKTNGHTDVKTPGPVVQIIAGSYERVLHGITASLSDFSSSSPSAQFADSFLFNAHASSIRCLALSPLPDSEDQGIYLATGGSDERVNVYSLSASPLSENDKIPSMPTLGSNKVSENPGNRELGTLMQHSSNITALYFPTRSKLFSGSEDNTIAVSRTRDLSTIETIKVPRPKAVGQPSGDTAPVGATPAGVNDFAVHSSMKLMISVGRGERCMRMWNVMTGKKAGVLNFDRAMLAGIMESKHSSGEGRKIRWNPSQNDFAVSFERGVIVFGEDSKPKCSILPQPLTKVHQIHYFAVKNDEALLAVSTEDGRILFYDTTNPTMSDGKSTPNARVSAQLGGRAIGMSGRIKDFKMLSVKSTDTESDEIVVVTASSDGTVKVWRVETSSLQVKQKSEKINQVGTLVGSYDTGNRITCLEAFIMLPASEEFGGLSEFEGLTDAEEDESSSDSDDE